MHVYFLGADFVGSLKLAVDIRSLSLIVIVSCYIYASQGAGSWNVNCITRKVQYISLLLNSSCVSGKGRNGSARVTPQAFWSQVYMGKTAAEETIFLIFTPLRLPIHWNKIKKRLITQLRFSTKYGIRYGLRKIFSFTIHILRMAIHGQAEKQTRNFVTQALLVVLTRSVVKLVCSTGPKSSKLVVPGVLVPGVAARCIRLAQVQHGTRAAFIITEVTTK